MHHRVFHRRLIGAGVIQPLFPQEAQAGLLSSAPPTYGDYLDMRANQKGLADPEERKAAFRAFLRSIPLVRVHGGNIDADVTGSVDVSN